MEVKTLFTQTRDLLSITTDEQTSVYIFQSLLLLRIKIAFYTPDDVTVGNDDKNDLRIHCT